ncbi:MAG: virulence RhuM family protein [Fibrobacteraceae bacterium]|nr:virulence RhuM family protein [Fibrobacteraceae bacterium]
MIISVGYRVNSLRSVQFRMWATKALKEYIAEVVKEKADSESMRKIGNSDFSTKPTNIYNLDVIITRFRQWATGVLRENLLHKNSMNVQLF